MLNAARAKIDAVDEIEQSRMLSHFGDEGPVNVAFRTLQALAADDFYLAWSFWDGGLRRAASEHWVEANSAELVAWQGRPTDEMIRVLANASDPQRLVGADSELWQAFAYTQLQSVSTNWAHMIELLHAGRLGAGSSTRVVGPDLEAVILTETDPENPLAFLEPTLVEGVTFIMRLTADGWRVATLDGSLPP